jgi:hypothetical protein
VLQEQTAHTPNLAAIRADLVFMTRRWSELGEKAVIEIRAFDEFGAPQIGRFAPDWLDGDIGAVQWIADMNRRGRNCYVVRNPVRDNVAGAGANDGDILAAFYLWADCDEGTAAENVLRFPGPKWVAAVTTGKVPSTRVHTYWELKEACTDLAAWRDMQSAIARHFGSDPSVINPSRIMRIGGTISWPSVKKRGKGYVEELTTIRTEYPEPREPVTMDQMRRAFATSAPAAPPLQQTTSAPGGLFQIDTGNFAPTLDRERLAIQAMSGMEWHNAVIRLVASYVGKGLSDTEIHALTQPLTLPGYTGEQTYREVQTAIDGARRKGWTPEPQYADPAALQTSQAALETGFDAPKRRLELEWYDDVEPVLGGAYLVKGLLDTAVMAVIYGPSNSGKTFWTIDLAYHIAIGAPWRGRRVIQASVLYLAAEGGRGVINRVAALKQSHGVLDVPLAVKRAGLDLLHDQADLQHIVDLSAEVKARLPDAPHLIVIDTLSRVMAGGDENSAADMTALIRNIDAIRATTGATTLLVHHTGKDAARGARGHSSLRAATDTEIEIANEDGARAAVVTKQRDHNGGETFAFDLKSVSLGHDQDGDEVTSCIVEPRDGDEFNAAKKAAKGRGKNQQIIMEAFDQMVAEGLAVGNPGGVGMPEPGQFWAVDAQELRTIAQGKMVGDNAAKLFRTAWDALTGPGGIFVAGNNLAWRIDRRRNK